MSPSKFERPDRKVVVLAVEDCAAPFERIREAHNAPPGARRRAPPDEERLTEEVPSLRARASQL